MVSTPFITPINGVRHHLILRGETSGSDPIDFSEPEAVVSIHPLDLAQIGALAGDVITVQARRGVISLKARADGGTPTGAVFIPFAFYEAAANLLTNPALDPVGKIAEVKYCAVKITGAGR